MINHTYEIQFRILDKSKLFDFLPIFVKKLNIIETQLLKFNSDYHKLLDKHNLPHYYYLNDELVIVVGYEKKKRPGKANSKQVYYHTSCGKVKHASRFKKVDIKPFIRDKKIEDLLK